MKLKFALYLAVPACLLAQHEKTGEKSRHPFIGDVKAIEEGKKIFSTGCAACHGAEGQGGRGPSLRERVFWHPVEDETLYKAIQKGVGGGMPPANLSEDQAWQVVAFVRALTSPAIETPLASGDPKMGETIFWGKAGCSNCHAIRGRGGKLGPDLGNAGSTLALPDIKESILDPDADGNPNYRPVDLLLKNGKRVKGVARNYTNYSLQVQDKDGNLHLIWTRDVSEMSLSKSSPMPKDYGKRLSGAEIDHLAAYLSRQSIREVKPGETARKAE
jgi:cytochrome c oxidase cbb3-type subunit 3